ncbi:MAG: N-formylglutamate amidohydrolase [Beijerinckiaceae bacterium]|nr:MAG: N-formylglutamate amidohydrolase [Beijerinckiaceae bacterium]
MSGRVRIDAHAAKVLVDGQPHEPELDPPFDVFEPSALASPLVFSSPHSGAIYPRRFLTAAKLDATALRRSEDAYVDELFAGVVAHGAPLLRARFPRAYLDLNREPYELDPRMFDGRLPVFANTRSVRVAGGLGTIARIVGESQEIYGERLKVDEALARIEKLYKPYHHSLRSLLDRAHQRFGLAVLIDCHSMPSVSSVPSPDQTSGQKMKADFILGDRYGTSCETVFVDTVEYELRRLGYHVTRNRPYAGGFITEHYGDTANQFHALQIEVNRGIYMDERTMEKALRFAQIAEDLCHVADQLAGLIATRRDDERAAAE